MNIFNWDISNLLIFPFMYWAYVIIIFAKIDTQLRNRNNMFYVLYMFYTQCYILYVFVYGGPCKENFLTGWFFLHILSKWLVKKVTILFISIRAVTTLSMNDFLSFSSFLSPKIKNSIISPGQFLNPDLCNSRRIWNQSPIRQKGGNSENVKGTNSRRSWEKRSNRNR